MAKRQRSGPPRQVEDRHCAVGHCCGMDNRNPPKEVHNLRVWLDTAPSYHHLRRRPSGAVVPQMKKIAEVGMVVLQTIPAVVLWPWAHNPKVVVALILVVATGLHQDMPCSPAAEPLDVVLLRHPRNAEPPARESSGW